MWNFILIILLISATVYAIIVTRKSFQYQDAIDDFLDVISDSRNEMENVLGFFNHLMKYNIMLDTPEIREMVSQIKKGREVVKKIIRILGEAKEIEKEIK